MMVAQLCKYNEAMSCTFSNGDFHRMSIISSSKLFKKLCMLIVTITATQKSWGKCFKRQPPIDGNPSNVPDTLTLMQIQVCI